DEDVELAEMPDGLLYHVVAERGIDEIAGDHQAFPAHRVDCLAGLVGIRLLFWQMDDRHPRAFTRIQQRYRTADSRIAAGNKRDLVLQLAGRPVRFGLVVRVGIEFRFESRTRLMLLRKRRLRPVLARCKAFFRLRVHSSASVQNWTS